MSLNVPTEHVIEITWALDNSWIKLLVDLSVPEASITGTSMPPLIIEEDVASEAQSKGLLK